MYGARIVEKATTKALLSDPLHPYTWLCSRPHLIPTRELESLQGSSRRGTSQPLNPPKGCRFYPRCAKIIKGKCDHFEPPEFHIGDDQSVFCWLYEDQANNETHPLDYCREACCWRDG